MPGPPRSPAVHLRFPTRKIRIRAGKMRKRDEPLFELLFVGRRDGWWEPAGQLKEDCAFQLAARVDRLVSTIVQAGPWPATTSEVELEVSNELGALLESGEDSSAKHLFLAGRTEIVPPETKHLHMVRFHLVAASLHTDLEDAERRAESLRSRNLSSWVLAPEPQPVQLSTQPDEKSFRGPAGKNLLRSFAHYKIRRDDLHECFVIDRPDGSMVSIERVGETYEVAFHGVREVNLDRFDSISPRDLHEVVDYLVAGKRSTVRERYPLAVEMARL